MKKTAHRMGENITNHIADKGLIIRTLKELSQKDKPNITQTNALIKKIKYRIYSIKDT